MFIVGLTGGIGSGKSAAATVFRRLGVTVIDADQVAREVVEPGTTALAAIVDRHGSDILLADGSLDRASLRSIVFQQDAERRWLEQLTHPIIGETIFERLQAAPATDEASYRILESPLLMETSQKDLTHRLLLIDIPVQLQIERTVSRDQNTVEQVNAIIAAQMPREQKRQLADDIIENTGTLQDLETQCETRHRQYLELATQP